MKKYKKYFTSLIIFILIVGGGWLIYKHFAKSGQPTTTYQTSTAEKGTLIKSVSASGTISASPTTSITSTVSGTVSEVLAKNGDSVTKDQKLFLVTLDDSSEQKKAAAYSNYLSAQNSEKTAEQNKSSLNLQVLKDQDSVLNAQNDVNYKNNNTINPTTKTDYTDLEKQMIDSSLTQAQKNLELSQQKYSQADAQITSAKAQISSASLAYQQYSSTIAAPASGVLTNFNLAVGDLISSNSSSSADSSSSSSSTNIGSITQPRSNYEASVSLSEVDVASVKLDQKVTLTLDAYTDKTFTGKVSSVDTAGTVNSGVTTYTATVRFDKTDIKMYANMAVSAEIITSIKNDVVLIPSTAITTSNDASTVQIKKSGTISTVTVEIGDANDTQTEITSGISEGDIVVTSSSQASTSSSTSNSTTGSPFSSFGGGGQTRVFTGGGPRD